MKDVPWHILKEKQFLNFQTHFCEKLEMWNQKGYSLSQAEVNYIVYWYDKEMEREFKILLPKVVLKKV